MAALNLLKKPMRRHTRPKAFATDRLRCYGSELEKLGRGHPREIGRWMNTWAENSRQPFRRQERAMLRFWRIPTLQKFASVHAWSITTFRRSAISRTAITSNRPAPPLWLSGAAFWQPET